MLANLPASHKPSLIEKIHAEKVSLLPLRNDRGSYDHHALPDLSSSNEIADYIQARTAAWSQHLQRLRQREQNVWSAPKGTKKRGGKKG